MTSESTPIMVGGGTRPAARRSRVDSEVRVLLVGPPTDVLDDVADVVRIAGFSVQTSWHAADALFLMGKAYEAGAPIHLVIADEAMSGVDAPLFAALMREDERISSARLLLLERSAEGEPGRYSAAGYDGRIGPAADASLVSDTIDRVLGSSVVPSVDAEMGAAGALADANRGPSILVVEDNAINMEVACELVRRIGYSCDRAVNGQEAVDAVKRISYDLVLMDCQLPGMDGYEAASRIRTWEERNPEHGRVPIVAVTAHAMTGDRERCLAAGMDDYMTKPVDARRLGSVIASWLTARRASIQEPAETTTDDWPLPSR